MELQTRKKKSEQIRTLLTSKIIWKNILKPDLQKVKWKNICRIIVQLGIDILSLCRSHKKVIQCKQHNFPIYHYLNPYSFFVYPLALRPIPILLLFFTPFQYLLSWFCITKNQRLSAKIQPYYNGGTERSGDKRLSNRMKVKIVMQFTDLLICSIIANNLHKWIKLQKKILIDQKQ